MSDDKENAENPATEEAVPAPAAQDAVEEIPAAAEPEIAAPAEDASEGHEAPEASADESADAPASG